MTESLSPGASITVRGINHGELGGSSGAGKAAPDFGVASESRLEVGPFFFRVLPAAALIPAVAGVFLFRRGGKAPPC